MSGQQAENPEFAQIVEAVVLGMPAARHLGFSFRRVERGEVEIVQPYRTELTEHNGNFQGGVIGSLADFAGGSAAGTLLPAGWVNMTVDYTVKLLSPARGEYLVARGRVVKPGKRSPSRRPRSTVSTRAPKHSVRQRWSRCETSTCAAQELRPRFPPPVAGMRESTARRISLFGPTRANTSSATR